MDGVAGFYRDHPIKVTTGEPVRVYVVNMLEHEPLASFHLHAETFDVSRQVWGGSPRSDPAGYPVEGPRAW